MSKKYAFSFLLFLMLGACSKHADNDHPAEIDDDLLGPISRPEAGYGSDGSYTVATQSFASPTYNGKQVTVFYPKEATGPRPVIFYSHPYGGEEVNYNLGLYQFIAKKGFVIVFAPYPTTGVDIDFRYNTLWQSFKKAVQDYPNIIDIKKVGFVGHSFGGGASFGLAAKAFAEEGWGQDGRFIFSMAQWYSYWLTDAQLKGFPSNTKLVTQVYDDDETNDHRLAIDVFKNINIANAEKDFILVKPSTLPNYAYTADHSLPSTRNGIDAYDYYAVYRIIDALIDYSFKGNVQAKDVCLGNGSLAQKTMPSYHGVALQPLLVTDNPTAQYPQTKYLFKCTSLDNPRLGNCQ